MVYAYIIRRQCRNTFLKIGFQHRSKRFHQGVSTHTLLQLIFLCPPLCVHLCSFCMPHLTFVSHAFYYHPLHFLKTSFPPFIVTLSSLKIFPLTTTQIHTHENEKLRFAYETKHVVFVCLSRGYPTSYTNFRIHPFSANFVILLFFTVEYTSSMYMYHICIFYASDDRYLCPLHTWIQWIGQQ